MSTLKEVRDFRERVVAEMSRINADRDMMVEFNFHSRGLADLTSAAHGVSREQIRTLSDDIILNPAEEQKFGEFKAWFKGESGQ